VPAPNGGPSVRARAAIFGLRTQAPICPWWKLEGNESHRPSRHFRPGCAGSAHRGQCCQRHPRARPLVTHLVPISPTLVSMSFIFGLWRDTSSRVGAAELFRIQRIELLTQRWFKNTVVMFLYLYAVGYSHFYGNRCVLT